ncbi:MAG: holo-ACP synthase [Lactobacillus sp.]|nr:holo-ACP synthase [Lactobacillus sp.]MDN6043443.1 holo-ACP synthase [Lactobacillus sp.]MDN6053161.1 holo-ACP synthase [Lactobacillus sp.]
MIRGVGIDTVVAARIEKVVSQGDHFAHGVLTDKEYALYQPLKFGRKVEFLAGRFSVKESFSKAFGTGLGKAVGLKDVETLWDEKGNPVTTSTVYHGQIHVSISHDGQQIVTIVILEDR